MAPNVFRKLIRSKSLGDDLEAREEQFPKPGKKKKFKVKDREGRIKKLKIKTTKQGRILKGWGFEGEEFDLLDMIEKYKRIPGKRNSINVVTFNQVKAWLTALYDYRPEEERQVGRDSKRKLQRRSRSGDGMTARMMMMTARRVAVGPSSCDNLT
jgi:hypothetical protein